MAVFQDYARYYNLLYRDKDYSGETAFVLNILNEFGCNPLSLLDLGCGTAKHALEMAKAGIAVTGVDMSETMLALGRGAIHALAHTGSPGPLPELSHGDARTVKLPKVFDAATSLFHVLSYQTREEDALALFATAKAHLKPGGLFLFDFWHGSGVLADPPTRRARQWEDSEVVMTRIALPVHRMDEHIVEVHYTMTMRDKATNAVSHFCEVHEMRYWFLPELRDLAAKAGMQVMAEGGWMHINPPSASDWNAWMLIRL